MGRLLIDLMLVALLYVTALLWYVPNQPQPQAVKVVQKRPDGCVVYQPERYAPGRYLMRCGERVYNNLRREK